jgi:hypothetical protein
MAKHEKSLEQIDLETCRYLMSSIETAAGDLAEYGASFVGRSWITDKGSIVEVSEIYKETVHTLKAAYRRLSEAEEILDQEMAAVAPVARPGVVRRMLQFKSAA